MFRRSATVDPDSPPAVSRAMDVTRVLANLFTLLFFGGAMGIVVMTFTRGGV